MIETRILNSRGDWLKEREQRIGGSEAACLVGLNPWKSNVELFREKLGLITPSDLSDNEAVRFGSEAEQHIRGIFGLMHPEFSVDYTENNLWINSKYPFAHASLDGRLITADGEAGILEIKTTTILSGRQSYEWNGKIPDHYYCQVQWYMMVTETRFAWLSCLQRTTGNPSGCDELSYLRSYEIPRDDDAIEILAEAGARFYEALKTGQEPPIVLPQI